MSGRDFGRYRLTAWAEEDARTVLLAEDTLLERQVGLLLVPEGVAADPARSERIRSEVERAASFVHPDVSTVYGLEEGAGRLFVTLEPPEGRTLTSLLAAGDLPLETALQMALSLLDVVAAAKEEGVVHGSLHPGDVRLHDDGSIAAGGFGLRELRLAVEAESPESAPWAAYRPPESAPGLLPDHRTDLFVLGRLVREMLAGAAAPADPVSGEAREVPAEAASGLEAALDRFLSEDPVQRPEPAELRPHLERLQRELLREPEPEPEESARRRLDTPARWGLLAVGVLLAVLVGWAVWRLLDRAPEPVEPVAVEEAAGGVVEQVDLAVTPFAASDDAAEAFLAEGFSREVTRLLERDRRVSVISADSAARAGAEAAGAREVARRLDVAHLLEGRFVWQREEDLSRAEVTVRLIRAGDGEIVWDETLEGFFGEVAGLQDRVALAVKRRLGAGSRPGGRPLTDSAGAYEAYLDGVGRAARAVSPEDLRAAVESFERAAVLDSGLFLAHARQVSAQIRLAAAVGAPEALAAARQALAAAREIAAADPDVRRAAAELELASGSPAVMVREELEPALAGLPGQPDVLHAMALIDRRQGLWEEATQRLAEARRRDPFDQRLASDLVQTLAWRRQFDEATKEAERLASLMPGAIEPVLLESDLLVRQRGAKEEARAVLERAAEAGRSDPRWQERMLRLDLYDGEYDSALGRLASLRLERAEELIRRAWIERHRGRDRRAAAAFERARDLLDNRLEADAENPWLSSLLAQAYAGTGGVHLADRMGRRAVSQLPVTHNAVAGVGLVERLARVYLLAGDTEHALDELAFLLEIPSPVTVAVLRLDPAWEPLRGDKRFQALLERFEP